MNDKIRSFNQKYGKNYILNRFRPNLSDTTNVNQMDSFPNTTTVEQVEGDIDGNRNIDEDDELSSDRELISEELENINVNLSSIKSLTKIITKKVLKKIENNGNKYFLIKKNTNYLASVLNKQKIVRHSQRA